MSREKLPESRIFENAAKNRNFFTLFSLQVRLHDYD